MSFYGCLLIAAPRTTRHREVQSRSIRLVEFQYGFHMELNLNYLVLHILLYLYTHLLKCNSSTAATHLQRTKTENVIS